MSRGLLIRSVPPFFGADPANPAATATPKPAASARTNSQTRLTDMCLLLAGSGDVEEVDSERVAAQALRDEVAAGSVHVRRQRRVVAHHDHVELCQGPAARVVW